MAPTPNSASVPGSGTGVTAEALGINGVNDAALPTVRFVPSRIALAHSY